MKKILLHTCCGPCFSGSYIGLKDENLSIVSYFSNPNIYPKGEWQKRLDNLSKVTEQKSIDLIIDPYQPEKHARAIAGKELDFPARCLDCYRIRLEDTALMARKLRFQSFSTTLLVSPYQNHQALKAIGEELSRKHGIDFYYKDLRPFYRSGQEEAKTADIYRQKYCGCRYSKEYK